MSSADSQPGFGFFIDLSNRECCHAVNAIPDDYECKTQCNSGPAIPKFLISREFGDRIAFSPVVFTAS
jgi:hypothetical protein